MARKLILFFLLINPFLLGVTYGVSPKTPPNIIIIYADDMGYGDVGYNGCKDILTPNIDQLAAHGVQFNQGYVSSSVCAPSRAGLLSGIYQQRFGLGENCSASGWPTSEISQGSGIPEDVMLAPELLKQKGYHTAMVGKWHLGMAETKRPNAKGFDYYFGFLNGAHSYYESSLDMGKKKGLWPLFENNEAITFDGYLTEVFTQKAVNYIKSINDQPYFLYLAYNAVHHPWEVPDSYVDRLEHIKLPNRRKFAAMVLALDDGVGEIIQLVKERGEEDNTIVLFISDNGSPSGQAKTNNPNDFMSSTGGLRGWKGDTYEGGVRVPFIMKWPSRIKPMQYNKPVINLDILPTLIAELNIKTTIPFDGVNLMPYVTGINHDAPHEVLYWRRGDDYAIRRGDWKLSYNNRGATTLDNRELFNLSEDPNESINLIEQFPELALELQTIFHNWDGEMPNSKWWKAPINRVKLSEN